MDRDIKDVPVALPGFDYRATGVELVFRCALCKKVHEGFFLAQECMKGHVDTLTQFIVRNSA